MLLVDWLFVGMSIASICSHLANKYLKQYHSHGVEQEVEWLYSFDVHANAFFCSFMVTYVLQVTNEIARFTFLTLSHFNSLVLPYLVFPPAVLTESFDCFLHCFQFLVCSGDHLVFLYHALGISK
jgi:hypothetical protein